VKIEIEVSELNEATRAPWWCIIDPGQNFKTGSEGVYNIASMITGPYFSREEAMIMLKLRQHHYSKNAVVFCFSGCYTEQYDKKMQEAERVSRLQKLEVK